ncbi:MAG: helix-turn-helix transcriptional regulator [Rhodospirillaceae bacterium]|nr:helix-turn-helix transcriptional regulator [Rhodospirillaceae bacterium]
MTAMTAKARKIGTLELDVPSGNAYADMGLPDASLLQARGRLAVRLAQEIAQRGLTQMQAARALGIAQPRVSEILNARLKKVSIEALMLYLNKLGVDVRIEPQPLARRARPSPRGPKPGHTRVSVPSRRAA